METTFRVGDRIQVLVPKDLSRMPADVRRWMDGKFGTVCTVNKKTLTVSFDHDDWGNTDVKRAVPLQYCFPDRYPDWVPDCFKEREDSASEPEPSAVAAKEDKENQQSKTRHPWGKARGLDFKEGISLPFGSKTEFTVGDHVVIADPGKFPKAQTRRWMTGMTGIIEEIAWKAAQVRFDDIPQKTYTVNVVDCRLNPNYIDSLPQPEENENTPENNEGVAPNGDSSELKEQLEMAREENRKLIDKLAGLQRKYEEERAGMRDALDALMVKYYTSQQTAREINEIVTEIIANNIGKKPKN